MVSTADGPDQFDLDTELSHFTRDTQTRCTLLMQWTGSPRGRWVVLGFLQLVFLSYVVVMLASVSQAEGESHCKRHPDYGLVNDTWYVKVSNKTWVECFHPVIILAVAMPVQLLMLPLWPPVSDRMKYRLTAGTRSYVYGLTAMFFSAWFVGFMGTAAAFSAFALKPKWVATVTILSTWVFWLVTSVVLGSVLVYRWMYVHTISAGAGGRTGSVLDGAPP